MLVTFTSRRVAEGELVDVNILRLSRHLPMYCILYCSYLPLSYDSPFTYWFLSYSGSASGKKPYTTLLPSVSNTGTDIKNGKSGQRKLRGKFNLGKTNFKRKKKLLAELSHKQT